MIKNRLFPDIYRAVQDNNSIEIRNKSSTRPWQFVLDLLFGYILLAEKMWEDGKKFSQGWNFGPEDDDVKPVSSIIEYLVDQLGDDASWIHDASQQPHEAQLLKLDISKSKQLLGWQPRWSLFRALDSIVEWQKVWLRGGDLRAVTLKQIREFEQS